MIKTKTNGNLVLQLIGAKHCRRNGFLLVEVVAGAGLAILVLGLTLTILKRDGDLRQRNENRALLLRTAENLAENCACLPYGQLTPEQVNPLVEAARRATGNPKIQLSLEIHTEAREEPRKRVHLSGGIEGGPALVHIWRDYYQEGAAK